LSDSTCWIYIIMYIFKNYSNSILNVEFLSFKIFFLALKLEFLLTLVYSIFLFVKVFLKVIDFLNSSKNFLFIFKFNRKLKTIGKDASKIEVPIKILPSGVSYTFLRQTAKIKNLKKHFRSGKLNTKSCDR
jgi:hypothetical protein